MLRRALTSRSLEAGGVSTRPQRRVLPTARSFAEKMEPPIPSSPMKTSAARKKHDKRRNSIIDDEASALSTSSSSSSSKSVEDDFAEIVLLLEGKLREAERDAEELRGILSSGECCRECDKKDEVITEMYDKVGQLQRELDKANREKKTEEDHHSDKKKKKFRRRSRSRASNASPNDQDLVDLDVVSVIRNMSELSSLLAESGRGVESGGGGGGGRGGGGNNNISRFRRPPAPIAVSFFKDGFR